MSEVENWLTVKLIPYLLEKNVLLDRPPLHVESIEAKVIQMDGWMLSAPYKLKIVYIDCDNKRQQLHLVVKKTPNVPQEIYDSCRFDALFETEAVAYRDILPLLSDADKYPRFYYSERNPLSAICVLEDFSLKGWRLASQLYDLPLDHILLAVKELGKLHGELYVLKETRRDLFNSIVAKLKETRYGSALSEDYAYELQFSLKRIPKAIKNSHAKDDIPEEFIQDFLDYVGDINSCLLSQVQPVEPLAVICHGDYLRNNINFKYDEQGTPIDIMMYDFQTIRYASPMIDLGTFFALSTSYKVRSANFDTIFHAYHDEIVKVLKNGLKSETLPNYYSYDSFMLEFAKFYPHGFLISTNFLKVMFSPFEPTDGPILENFPERTREELEKNAMEAGGDALDHELASMMLEIYRLHKAHKLTLDRRS